MTSCLYCKTPLENSGPFCSQDHKIKFREKQAEKNKDAALIIKSRGMSDAELELQKKFIKKQKKKDLRKKLPLSEGVL